MQSALDECAANTQVRAVYITGAGKAFCAGEDLAEVVDPQGPGMNRILYEHFNPIVAKICYLEKPVIAAVEGPAAGAGFSLALACDLIVAAQDSVFVMAYSNVALSPDGGGTWSLMQAMPRATALQLMLTGDRVDAQRLLSLGVISSVCGQGEALGEALALAEKLNARAPNALASIKELANDAMTGSLHSQLGAERDHFVRNLHHANAGEGIAAFLEKRPPQYR